MLYHREPYILRTLYPDQFRLAVVLFTSSHLITQGVTANTELPTSFLTNHQRAWLKELGIHEKKFVEAVKRMKEAY